MKIHIDDPRLAEEITKAAATIGIPVESFVTLAIQDRLRRMQGGPPRPVDLEAVRRLQHEISTAPVVDYRASDESFYDESGLPR